MAYSLINSWAENFGSNGGGTGTARDTTGANFLDVIMATDSGVTLSAANISDSKSNTWALIGTTPSGGFTRIHHFRAKNATSGAGHTITMSLANSYPAYVFSVWSGSNTTEPNDQSSGDAGTTGTSDTPGSITPSEDNCVIITGLADDNGGAVTLPSGFTTLGRQALVGATSYGVAAAYQIQTTATARNPSWTVASSTGIATHVASYKAAAAGGGTIGGPALGGAGRIFGGLALGGRVIQ